MMRMGTACPLLIAIAVHLFSLGFDHPSVADDTLQGDVTKSSRPNVLMIAIDDLNDWIEPLGGHPQVQTPGFNRLAARAVTFTNAHCQHRCAIRHVLAC